MLKVKLYAANFPCAEPYGHVCKYALSIHEDDYSVHLEPREHATIFIIRKPGLDGSHNSLSFELDDHRGYFLRRDGVKFSAQKGLIGASGILLCILHWFIFFQYLMQNSLNLSWSQTLERPGTRNKRGTL